MTRFANFMKFTGREAEYKELAPGQTAYYDGLIEVDLSKVKPMIAMPFHPSNTYTIEELNANLTDILADVEKKAAVSLDNAVPYSLKDKCVTADFMWIRESLQAAQAAALKISVRLRTF